MDLDDSISHPPNSDPLRTLKVAPLLSSPHQSLTTSPDAGTVASGVQGWNVMIWENCCPQACLFKHLLPSGWHCLEMLENC